MSISNRTSRRRRIAFGLGATGGGLLAAAFMPMGIALAAPVTPDPGLFPIDTETVPDPFADAFDVTGVANPGVSLADQQLDVDNSLVAAQFDYSIDNHIPFTFDGISSTVPGTFDPEAGDVAGTVSGQDPFEDALANTPAAELNPSITPGLAEQYDYALSQLVADGQLTAPQVAQLDGIADGTVTQLSGTLPVVPDNDPVADFVQIFDPHAFTGLPGTPEVPADFLGQLAVFDDNFLNAFGLGAPLDQLVDAFTGGLGSTTADTLTGLTSTIDPLSFLGL
jgi:hypothetical protein